MKAFLKSTFGLVLVVMAFFAVVAFFLVRSARQIVVAQAEESVRNLVKATTGKIDQLTLGVETAVANQTWVIDEHLADPDYMYRVTQELVSNNTYIVGSAVAFTPNYYPSKGVQYSPYTCDDGKGGTKSFQLGTDTYRYHESDWYVRPMKARRAVWSDPYFDEGGGQVWMSTYSVPIADSPTNFCAVLTADLSLRQLMDYVSRIRPYEDSYVIMKAGDKILVGAGAEAAKRQGRYDGKVLGIEARAGNGWTVEIGCPIEQILRGTKQVVTRIVVFSALGLLLIFSLSRFFALRLQRAAAVRERMAGELNTARNIQSDILPKDFPDNVYAILRPAREVGGDLYDFVREGDTLYFIIGDASGKGVPAALFSFMAGTVFRMACSMKLNPGEIVGRINAALAHNNEMCMFVTAFVGALDLKTGQLEFGCAGHNPPVVIHPDGTADFLTVKRGPPTGAVSGVYFDLQTAQIEKGAKIVVYTDGVTEAERADHTQYGEKRLLDFSAACAKFDVADATKGLLAAVDCFVDGAEQSDDITIMTIGMPE